MAKFKSERQTVYKQEELGSYQHLDGMKLGEMIALLQSVEKTHGPDARFNIDVDCDYGCNSGYTSINLSVSSTHLETPLEYAARHEQWQKIEKAKREQYAANKKLREENERKQYLRLQKKYGK